MRTVLKGLVVFLAVGITLALVPQAVEAITLEGTVLGIVHNTITLDVDNDGVSDVTVSSLGPKAYWRRWGMPYPKVGDYLYIDAYEGQTKCIAVVVCYDDDTCIELRDPDTLMPLWVRFQVE